MICGAHADVSWDVPWARGLPTSSVSGAADGTVSVTRVRVIDAVARAGRQEEAFMRNVLSGGTCEHRGLLV